MINLIIRSLIMVGANIDMTKTEQYAAAHSDDRVLITLVCTHLTNIVQFIIKRFFVTFRLEGAGGWSGLEKRHYV